MATYNSAAVGEQRPDINARPCGNVKVARASVTCTASPATTDTINFFDLPANSRIHFAILQASDMDTNGTPLLTLNVGYSGAAASLFSASTVGQAGTLATQNRRYRPGFAAHQQDPDYRHGAGQCGNRRCRHRHSDRSLFGRGLTTRAGGVFDPFRPFSS
jgi:hypothetical protein